MGELENRFRAARAYAGLSKVDLGVIAGRTKNGIRRIEHGARRLSENSRRAVIEDYAEATGLPEAFFTTDFTQLDEEKRRHDP
jgi:transcriptional regulator with XRE-family HTH domain